jgi:hypothetical protein
MTKTIETEQTPHEAAATVKTLSLKEVFDLIPDGRAKRSALDILESSRNLVGLYEGDEINEMLGSLFSSYIFNQTKDDELDNRELNHYSFLITRLMTHITTLSSRVENLEHTAPEFCRKLH